MSRSRSATSDSNQRRRVCRGNQLARSKEVMSLYIIDLLIVLARMARTKQPKVATEEAKNCLKTTMSLESLNSMMGVFGYTYSRWQMH
ncbi:hypothetical protein HanXRQr2_Chr16g0739561 [Helianthus annuus]|uniref:Uncharacterized protein n=1 Tax=Helianthus annuus TaxID=4232 RepID=A0A251RY73_HELAN|nr:hypothetical protein HanXRQr2_Chr16g0739561 [Helianthus annuus]KAJ0437525.1 hypothetical protein HanHA300_Chr16g0603141 [Helianthus annuus]KAJ0459844.1 hypothetical protein HanHA89_Chr16g0653671 [Helianthus annuus]KAJ0640310.1 hypothetical protein HanLR1_Chr16g0613941 [Helianthus annuus]KAJ0644258.1 hypothetical protein HanOQP8_Chr16g0609971 [Helianthus annuus]